MHEVWRSLLDDNFLEAYQHGIVLRSADGILRRVYPRIFTYSADYPEKYVLLSGNLHCMFDDRSRVLLATIRDRGLCPCPRCLVPRVDLDKLGHSRDAMRRTVTSRSFDTQRIGLARGLIYDSGISLSSVKLERLLKPCSLVPTIVRIRAWECVDCC